MFSVLFGRAATLTVLFNLNSRSTLANATNGTSEATAYVDTAVEPGQLFGGTADGWSPAVPDGAFPMRPPRTVRSIGAQNVAAAVEDTPRLEVIRDLKPNTDLEVTVGQRNSRASVVRVSFTTSAPSRLETGSDSRASTWPTAMDTKTRL